MRISDWSADVCSSDLREPVGDLVEQFERGLAFAVDLVDEGDDRHRTQTAHFEQLERLRLDTLGGVDHHHGAVDRGQRAIGVLAEILVPRRVEQVEDEPPMLEGHYRRCYRNAALLLELHPVGARKQSLRSEEQTPALKSRIRIS